MPVSTKLQVRRDNAATWTSQNPILAAGEIGFETDNLRFKIGNGSNTWANLAYQAAVFNGGTITNALVVSNTTGVNTSGQFTSTIATGTAPFVVSSTTRVANLNVATSGTTSNVLGGATGGVHYQSAANTTAFLAAPSVNNSVLTYNTTTNAPEWDSPPLTMSVLMGYTSTATAAGFTSLDNTSSYYQQFTGSTTQTVVMPNTATLLTGWTFHIVNNSTGNVTANTFANAATLMVIPSNTTAMVTCINTASNTATGWEIGLTDFGTYTGTGSVVMNTSPSIATPSFTNGITLSSTTTPITLNASVGTSGFVLTSGGAGATPTWTNPNLVNINATAKTGAYTLATGDYGTVVQMNGAFAFTVGTGLYNAPVGTQITLLALTAGVTVAASGAGVVVNSTPGLKLRAQYSMATLICLSSGASACTWLLTGDLSA
jgi:hypothetical protein